MSAVAELVPGIPLRHALRWLGARTRLGIGCIACACPKCTAAGHVSVAAE